VKEVFDRHEHGVLQFSGGKESLACLELTRPWWDKLTVIWVDSGDSFPETREQMMRVADTVPYFMAVKANQPQHILDFGLPADVLGVWNTPGGREFRPGDQIRLQDPLMCCKTNRWDPMQNAIRVIGATLVVRGQRKNDRHKGPQRSGQVLDGVEYLFPLEGWDESRVLGFLLEKGIELPRSYEFNKSSLDCQHCTAFLGENQGKLKYMDKYHPEVADVVRFRLRTIRRAVQEEMAPLNQLLGD
jgi:phosphoadenosine phosphosulfate reductase